MIWRKFPYTNFHEMNMDQLITVVKLMIDEWVGYNEKWEKLYQDIDTAFDAFKADFDEHIKQYDADFQNFINSIDVNNELRKVFDQAVADGSVSNLINPLVISTTEAWLRENITVPEGVVIDRSLTIAGACADAKVVGSLVKQVDNALNLKPIYPAGSPETYITGLESTTNIYFLMNGQAPVVIPKSATVAYIRLINPSTYTHNVCLYFFAREENNRYRLLRKIPNLNMDGDRPLSIDVSTLNTDVCIAIRNETSYGLKCVDNGTGAITGIATVYSGVEPAVGDVLTPNVGNYNRSYGVDVWAFMPNIRDQIITAGNNNFMFKNHDITDDITWIPNRGFAPNTFDASRTVDNYHYMLTQSSVGDTSKPIQIRDETGTLINDISVNDVSPYPEAFLVAEFNKYGLYIRTLTAGDFINNGFSNDAYYVVLRKFNNYGTRYLINKIKVDWLDNERTTYNVGASGDFTTFTQMLKALKNDSSPKTVYVDAGIYDIYSEKGGAAYIASIINPESLNWRDVSEVVPDNTHIIGKGKVVLKWNPPADIIGSDAMANLFSPLNVSGSCVIENIEIECSNCRYAIHDETSSRPQWKYVEREYKNIKATKTHGVYGYNQVYGAGIAPSGKYEFNNCIFVGDRSGLFTMHTTSMQQNDKVNVVLDNCEFIKSDEQGYVNKYIIGFGNTHTSERHVDVSLNNCWINGNIHTYGENGTPNTINAFSIKTLGCNEVVIATEDTSTKEISQKNVFNN